MAAQLDLEQRLRRYAQEYDRELPTMAMLERRIIARVAITPRTEPRRPSLPRELALAGLVVIAVALLAVGVAYLRAINPPVVSHPKPKIVQGPGIKGAGPPTVEFVSGSVGWVAEMSPPATPGQPPSGPTILFGTTDAGRHWQRQLSWDGPPPAQMRFSPNGREGLVVGSGGVPIYHTGDGGAHWQRMTMPDVVQGESGAEVYFLNPREGWVLSYLQEATPGFVGLFHTNDGGASWARIARLDVNAEFADGQPGGSIQGAMVFKDSSTGWLLAGSHSGTGITPAPPFLFITRDGGLTWQVQTLASPSGAQLDSSNALFSAPVFFNARDGLLGLTPIPQPPAGAGQAATLPPTYLYRTADGGAHWSYLLRLPSSLLGAGRWESFIDLNHWVLFDGARLIRTSDQGQHWSPIPGGLPAGNIPVRLIFNDPSNGWAVLYDRAGVSRLYRTTDGGRSWSQVGLPSP